jgi:hypothetical protein
MKPIVYGLFDPNHCVIRYIGKTIRTDEKRLTCHEDEAFITRDNNWHRLVCSWIRELMIEGRSPDIVVLEECETEQEALDLEMIWIARLRADGARLLNMADGGEGISGLRHTEESKAKIAEASRNQTWTEDRKRRISEAVSGERNPWFGRVGPRKGVHLSDETKAKMSASTTGTKRPDQSGDAHWLHRAGAESPFKGMKHSAEANDKNCQAQLGKKYPNRRGKRVVCLDTGAVFEQIKAAARFYDVDPQRFLRAIKAGELVLGLRFAFVPRVT